ncbi:hypothetical protein ACPG8G_13050 [Pseudomonas aeruginosa]|uniref:hypothetical protein n=1 Tax=Pseudomonas aeruginosa TaxID=287 RepID=UPI00290294CC|nr:hypothetical protein [Pseudomonas aeruginosa]MDU0668349.1 hypothetical protein [Pseudomonas aeruginosa]
MQQRYLLTIHDLFTVRDGVRCGGEAFVAILDDQDEIDRLRFAGMTSPGSAGYRRSYSGRAWAHRTTGFWSRAYHLRSDQLGGVSPPKKSSVPRRCEPTSAAILFAGLCAFWMGEKDSG